MLGWILWLSKQSPMRFVHTLISKTTRWMERVFCDIYKVSNKYSRLPTCVFTTEESVSTQLCDRQLRIPKQFVQSYRPPLSTHANIQERERETRLLHRFVFASYWNLDHMCIPSALEPFTSIHHSFPVSQLVVIVLNLMYLQEYLSSGNKLLCHFVSLVKMNFNAYFQ